MSIMFNFFWIMRNISLLLVRCIYLGVRVHHCIVWLLLNYTDYVQYLLVVRLQLCAALFYMMHTALFWEPCIYWSLTHYALCECSWVLHYSLALCTPALSCCLCIAMYFVIAAECSTSSLGHHSIAFQLFTIPTMYCIVRNCLTTQKIWTGLLYQMN